MLDATGIGCPCELWCFGKPRSYTGEDVVEIHVPALRRSSTSSSGSCSPAARGSPSAGSSRGARSINGRLDLTRAEAIAALSRAGRTRARRRAIAPRRRPRARDRVVRGPRRRAARADRARSRLLRPGRHHSRFGPRGGRDPRARRGPRGVRRRVEAGGPAAASARRDPRTGERGKSSLFNALLAREDAIATPHAGTTRDVLCAEWRHGETRALLVDTAGDDVARHGARRARDEARERAMLEADVVLEVRDVRKGGWPPPRFTRGARRDHGGPRRRRRRVAPRTSALVSNVTGAGLDALARPDREALACAAARSARSHFSSRCGSGHVVRARALERAAAVVSSGPSELAASDLRAALRELRAIRGAEGSDPVLDRIFQRVLHREVIPRGRVQSDKSGKSGYARHLDHPRCVGV